MAGLVANLTDVAPEDDRLHRIVDLLRGTHRSIVPIRESFLQMRGTPPTPGPLSALVRGKHQHALDVYLLLHAAAVSPPYWLNPNPDYWAVLTQRPGQSFRNARLAFHRSLGTLASLDLIRVEASQRSPLVQLLDESGKGDTYFHPSKTGDRYLTLPHRYWLDGLDRRLDLAGKAVLLLARSLRPKDFTLPLANAFLWYGISPQTLRRGMRRLIDLQLVSYTPTVVPAANAPEGTTIRRTYTLVGSMARTPGGERPPDESTNPELPF